MQVRHIGFLGLFLILCGKGLFAQENERYHWYDPVETIERFEGQGWSHIGYHRLPNHAEGVVRDAVWSLSQHAAGLGLQFESDADSIAIEYQVDGNLFMHHMPATGVSGIDLYVKSNNEWLWCRGKYSFKDTVRYDFAINNLSKGLKTYSMYFPLYNTIKNLKIGVPHGKTFLFRDAVKEKPIVVYGTSIAQGACASRPGMAWTHILSRALSRPVVNLGFSGNGRLEPEVIDLITQIEASLFILDCLPNLSPNKENTKKEVQNRLRSSVRNLRAKHPRTPILLTQHAGYSDGLVNSAREKVYLTLNEWLEESFKSLKAEGISNIYMLTKKDIGLSNDAFVDGTHPTDLGMQQYAMAYATKIKAIQSGM
ncbi:SGNH/GDSL hydrolase family protein [Pareuzebyella sediminis]|uniref:SGNH/GDSL hydrolase family protein n=1 Tax=Pareuzebyella sediminis TaxID=2607998 RepID=UPI0011ED479E|nr:SGNH/GDSL hydrolase family protein [Pareuzebyella sediminis]